jgi:predicted RecB family nuclease
MNISTSPSALMLADDCRLAHHFSYDRGLQLASKKRSPTLASGTAVHYAVEQTCQNFPQQKPRPDDLEALGYECLCAEFAEDEDGGDSNVKKFLPGVKRALARIPEWVWSEFWLTEREETVTLTRGDDVLEIHGRPDMYRVVNDGETPYIEIVDVKTTDKDPLQYMLFSPQLRMYALMLRQRFPEHLIQYRYVCVPTKPGNAVSPHSAPFIFTARMLAQTVDECWQYAEKLIAPITARTSIRCDWCDFKNICIQRLMGNDYESVITDEYITREERYESNRRKQESELA